jgi:hypothetical protein
MSGIAWRPCCFSSSVSPLSEDTHRPISLVISLTLYSLTHSLCISASDAHPLSHTLYMSRSLSLGAGIKGGRGGDERDGWLATAVSCQLRPYRNKRRRILSTAALSCQLPPYLASYHLILPTTALSYQPTPYPANRCPIPPTSALPCQPTPYSAKPRPILPADTQSQRFS